MTEELKPCPFCGSDPIIEEDRASEKERFIMICGNVNCPVHIYTGWYETEDKAIKAWNTRAEAQNDE